MPSLSPDPRPATAAVAPASKRSAVVGALVGMGALIGLGWYVLKPQSDQPLSAAQTLARAVAFERATPLLLTPVLPAEKAAAVAAMQLSATQQTQLEQSRAELVWVTLWDDQAEDGDVITIQSDGFSQSVRLANNPVRIAVPHPRSGAVSITGQYDGGGGITVGAQSGSGPIFVPVLTVGQSIAIPAR